LSKLQLRTNFTQTPASLYLLAQDAACSILRPISDSSKTEWPKIVFLFIVF